jgi:hypothetical protein
MDTRSRLEARASTRDSHANRLDAGSCRDTLDGDDHVDEGRVFQQVRLLASLLPIDGHMFQQRGHRSFHLRTHRVECTQSRRPGSRLSVENRPDAGHMSPAMDAPTWLSSKLAVRETRPVLTGRRCGAGLGLSMMRTRGPSLARHGAYAGGNHGEIGCFPSAFTRRFTVQDGAHRRNWPRERWRLKE